MHEPKRLEQIPAYNPRTIGYAWATWSPALPVAKLLASDGGQNICLSILIVMKQL